MNEVHVSAWIRESRPMTVNESRSVSVFGNYDFGTEKRKIGQLFFLQRGALDARLKRSESCKILKHQFTCCCHLLVNIRRPIHSLKSSSLKGVPASAQLTLMNWT